MKFDGQGHIRQYEGGCTDYLEAHEKRFGTAPDMSPTTRQPTKWKRRTIQRLEAEQTAEIKVYIQRAEGI